MIYLVTSQKELFTNDCFTIIDVKQSLDIMSNWKIVQLDTETTGTDFIIDKILTIQFGNFDGNIQIVVDCTTVDILSYKGFIENKFIIGQT